MRKLAIITLIIGVALLLNTSRASAQSETCTDFAQGFTVPTDFPITDDSDVWTIIPEANGILVGINEAGDGASIDSTSGTFSGVSFRLHLDSNIDLTHISFDVQSVTSATAHVEICDDVDCMSYTTILNAGNQATPFTLSDDTLHADVNTISITVATVGAGNDVSFDNLSIEGTLSACLFRPVLTVDTVNEVAVGNDYVILTTQGAKAFAVDDALVATVLHDSTGYTVGLLVNGVDTIVYSHLSAVFATIGDEIQGGCVLGYAGDQPPDAQVGSGNVYYHHDPDLGDWHDFGQSLSNTPCNQPDSNCLNANPEFNNNGEGWLSRYAIADSLNAGEDSIMQLPQHGQIYQSGFEVTTGDTYYVTVVVALTGVDTTGSLTVWIGGTQSTLPISTSGPEFVTITTLGLSPAWNGTSEFRITNDYTGGSTIKITFACLHTGDVSIAPPRCYFEDAQLTTDSFTAEGGATFEPSIFGVGRYSIPVGGDIRAPVDLGSWDADKDYSLKIQGAAPDGTSELTANIVDTGTEDEIQTISTYSYSSALWADITNTFTVPSTTEIHGDLLIKNTGAETVLVSALCLSAVDGIWPGYENPDHVNHSLLPIDCTTCTFPESLLDVVAWLNWLGCLFNYLIRCLLYTLVNNIWQTILAIMSGIGLFGRWLGQSITLIANWVWAAIQRGLAIVLASAIPIINAILAWILTLPFVRDVLDSISLAGIFLNGIFQFINGVVALFVAAVRFMQVLFAAFTDAWTAFFSALSGSSEITFGFPDCMDSGDPLYELCLPLDILNFAVAKVPALLVLFAAAALGIVWPKIKQAKTELEEVLAQ